MDIIGKKQLIDLVIEQILSDIVEDDMTHVENLLTFIPVHNLVNFLREGHHGIKTNYRKI